MFADIVEEISSLSIKEIDETKLIIDKIGIEKEGKKWPKIMKKQKIVCLR